MSKAGTSKSALEDKTEEELQSLFDRYRRLESIFLFSGLILAITGTIVMIIVSYKAVELIYLPIVISVVGIIMLFFAYPISKRKKDCEWELSRRLKGK